MMTRRPFSCEPAAGAQTCAIDVGVALKNPGPDDDQGYHTVYRLSVDVRAGKVLAARWTGVAG